VGWDWFGGLSSPFIYWRCYIALVALKFKTSGRK
jgi:hypothetical protein